MGCVGSKLKENIVDSLVPAAVRPYYDNKTLTCLNLDIYDTKDQKHWTITSQEVLIDHKMHANLKDVNTERISEANELSAKHFSDEMMSAKDNVKDRIENAMIGKHLLSSGHTAMKPVQLDATDNAVTTLLREYQRWWKHVGVSLSAGTYITAGTNTTLGVLARYKGTTIDDIIQVVVNAKRQCFRDSELYNARMERGNNKDKDKNAIAETRRMLGEVLSNNFVQRNKEYVLFAATDNADFEKRPNCYLKVYKWVRSQTGYPIDFRQQYVFYDIPIWILLNIKTTVEVSTSIIHRMIMQTKVNMNVYTSNVNIWKNVQRVILARQRDPAYIGLLPNSSLCWEQMLFTSDEQAKEGYKIAITDEWLYASLPNAMALVMSKSESLQGTIWMRSSSHVLSGREEVGADLKDIHICHWENTHSIDHINRGEQ